MLNDSVREELASRITTGRTQTEMPVEKTPSPPQQTSRGKLPVTKPVNQIKLSPSPKNVVTKRSNTSEIVIKNTNRTLVDFQKRQNSIPEWRLQLQNVVQKRMKNKKSSAGVRYVQGTANSPSGAVSLSSGALNDLENLGIELPVAAPDDQRLVKALNRIEQSRNTYLIRETTASAVARKKAEDRKPGKDFPFTLTPNHAKTSETPEEEGLCLRSKPTLVPRSRATSKNLYDTSELDPEFIDAKVSTSFDKKRPAPGGNPVGPDIQLETPEPKVSKVETKAQEQEIEQTDETEVYDDIAPFSLRFNSGLFDMIIGSFVSLILLAPFMLLGGSWFTVAGFFGFAAVFAVVMFIYLTTTIGMYGKSVGMRLFSLEMIDIGGDEYASFHQAAVSSSVFLLSLAFGGIGFLSSIFDEEGRAVHDLVSGTIIVREF